MAQLTQTLLDMAVDSGIDPDMVREFAHQVLASGTPEACDELSATMTPISDGVHNMLYVPWKGSPRHPLARIGQIRHEMFTATFGPTGRTSRPQAKSC